ncbi:MAG TPA: spirocyclase AveC family protein, partial [Mycobacterium sp.]
AYIGHWYTYNAWQVNMGSWVNSLPGALAPGTPTHQVAFPLLIVPCAYVVIFVLVTMLGAAIMRRVIPNTWFGAHSTVWNKDTQTRSYLTYTCGEGPGIACPSPDIPLLRNDNRKTGANGRELGQHYPPRYPYGR